MPEYAANTLDDEQTIDFEQIENEAGRRNHHIDEILGIAAEDTDIAPYEANRLESKNLLKTELALYLPRFPDDKKYCDTLKSLIGLAQTDVTSSSQVWKEGDAYDKGIQNLKAYLSSLDDEEEALRKTSEKLLKRPGKDGTLEWIPNDEINADPQLRTKDVQLSVKAEIIDEKRLIFSDLIYYLEAQRNGRLVITEPDARVINASGKNFNIRNYRETNQFGNRKTNAKESSVIDHSNAPLFPHEPNTNDISQGAWGNCFLETSLSNIARLYPEKIKENIRENSDGKTVTVRLFAKDSNGNHSPIYVTVDKTSETTHSYSNQTIGGENCLWVNCYEKAVVASGLYSSASVNNDMYWQPVPCDIEEKYKRYKEIQDRGELLGDVLNSAVNECPALFTQIENEYVLMPWPSYESIRGGYISTMTEMLLGPGYENKMISLRDTYSSIRNRKYIGMDISTPEKFLAFSMANNADDRLLETNRNDHTKVFDFSGSEEELANRAIASSCLYGEGLNDPYLYGEQKTKDAYREFLDTLRTIIPDFRSQTSGTLIPILNSNKNLLTACGEDDRLKITVKEMMFQMIENTAKIFSEYTYAEDKLFNKIKRKVDGGVLVGAGSIGYDPNHPEMNDGQNRKPKSVPGGHAYSVVRVFENEKTGKRFVRLRNPWGVDDDWGFKNGFKDINFHTFVHDMDSVSFNGMENVNEQVAVQEKMPYRGPSETGILDFNSYFRYLTAIDDACVAYCWTERAFDGSSKEYKELKTALKQTRHNLLKLEGKPFDEVKKLMDNLSEKIEAYDKRCQDVPKNNWRRNTRIQITSMLKDIVKCSELSVADPTHSIKQEYAKKVAGAIAAKNNVQLTPEKAAVQGAELLKSPEFRAAIKDKNIFTMKCAGNKDLKRQADTIMAIRQKNAVFVDKQPIARNI